MLCLGDEPASLLESFISALFDTGLISDEDAIADQAGYLLVSIL